MHVSFESLINILKKNEYTQKNNEEWCLAQDDETGQEFILIVRKIENLKEELENIERLILSDQKEAELSIRQFGIVFSDTEVVFLRLHPDNLQLNVQKLKKDLTKISPVFLKKYKELMRNLGDFVLWDKLFLRDDIIEEFYQLYSLARIYLRDNIEGIPDDVKKEDFAENLMLQLLIIWYLQEKRFLDSNINYLIDKFECYSDLGYHNYFSFLTELFEVMMTTPNDGIFHQHDKLGRIVVTGTAPFINGNFENVNIDDNVFYQEDQTELLKKIEPKKVAIAPILNLFESRDWTEGNIDEYVLGAIYEKIISTKERKESGAYYTPESITYYISEECIGSYLIERINNSSKLNFSSLNELFKDSNRETLILLFNELKRIKILDPTVGSAHFLESSIEFLLNLYKLIRNRLFNLGVSKGLYIKVLNKKGKIENIDLLKIKENQQFNLYIKFFIILSKNIYGVDINRSALKVGRARLFLTLAKHFDVDKNYFIMFPNVHFNLRPGNSLIGYVSLNTTDFPESQKSMDFFLEPNEVEVIYNKLELVSQLKEYLNLICSDLNVKLNVSEEIKFINSILLKKEVSLSDFKRILKFKEILIKILIVSLNSQYASLINDFLNKLSKLFNKKLNIKFAKGYRFTVNDLKTTNTFHWIFEFPEVFLGRNGFDILIGNPPYFRITKAPKEEQNIISELECFKEYHHGQGDIFYDFIVRSYVLLKNNGFFMFIVSRYWLEATYAKYLKKFIKEKINLLKILDFRELKIFRGVDINNTILSYKKELPNENNFDFDVYIYEKEQKELLWKGNPIDMMLYCGKYNINNWNINENWAFLTPKYKNIFLKIKNVQNRMGDICICSQNNCLKERYRQLFTFDFYPDDIPEVFIRKYRKMNEVNMFTVSEDIDKYIIIIHDLYAAIQNEQLKKFLKENAIERNELAVVPNKSKKNIDKFNEIIYIGYRVKRLDFSFIYNNNNTWVDNTYFFAKKSKINANFIHSFMYLLGILNSKLIRFYIDAIGKKKDKDLELGSEVLKDIPIKLDKNKLTNIEISIINQIEEITSEIVNLEYKKKNIIEKRDLLDNLVFDLFGINNRERQEINNYLVETNKLLFGEI
ncbi:MAG: Eco57I restriction-modification methylase domain-containing protein [Promethearchaeota archaeon]